jgi:hypothetical protein
MRSAAISQSVTTELRTVSFVSYELREQPFS